MSSGRPSAHEIDAQILHRLAEALADSDRRINAVHRARRAQPGLASDPLTGLASRLTLELHGASILARAGRYRWSTAVLVVDVDGFHIVNDRFGHVGGDNLLIEVGRRLDGAFRTYDTVARATVSRFAADEFVVVCEGVRDADAAPLVSRVQGAMAAPVMISGASVSVTASIGVAVAPPDDVEFDRLLLAAETSMRRAKTAGGARSEAVAGDDVASPSSEEIELRHALERGELRLHYQPKLVLADDRLAGVEALIRWEHPERGLLGPGSFIDLAERTNLVVPIGAWVIDEACRQTRRWLDLVTAGDFVTSVNVSVRQFGPSLVDTVRDALTAHDLPGEALCLEVTESVLIHDVAAGMAVLQDLASLGVQLSIDDFGTGYSSLSYLKQLPVHEVKIDQSFVKGLGTDPNDTAIVSTVIAMAHALDLCVVAEGVERIEQLERLRMLGCEQAQGFLFCRPQPASTITELMQSGTVRWAETLDEQLSSADATRVLVVDDNAEVRQLARMSLAATGFDVIEAPGGADALRLAAEIRPHCVVVDLVMPDMSGLELCRLLRSLPASKDASIVMLTANDHAEDKIQAFASGADDYVLKPFSPRELSSRVQAALRRRAQSRGAS